MAYSISRIVREKTDEHSDRLIFYGEPTPESIGPLRGFLDDGGTFQKMIFMTTEEHLKKIRPQAIAALEDSATLTTALPGMLEVRIQRCLSRQLTLHALTMLTSSGLAVLFSGQAPNDDLQGLWAVVRVQSQPVMRNFAHLR